MANNGVLLSIIMPVYNEEGRMTSFVNDFIRYCSSNIDDCEVIFVNDGSTDNSLEILGKLKEGSNICHIISYRRNRGKGYAVKRGINRARGKYCIFIDADGSISPQEIPGMLRLLQKNDVVIGDRYINRKEIKQPFGREFLGKTFNAYVNFLYRLRIKDTLCGFKGFKTDTAVTLFEGLISERWIFDVEILFKLRKSKKKIWFLPIKWEHKSDSKIRLIDPLKMAYRLFFLRARLLFSNTKKF